METHHLPLRPQHPQRPLRAGLPLLEMILVAALLVLAGWAVVEAVEALQEALGLELGQPGIRVMRRA